MFVLENISYNFQTPVFNKESVKSSARQSKAAQEYVDFMRWVDSFDTLSSVLIAHPRDQTQENEMYVKSQISLMLKRSADKWPAFNMLSLFRHFVPVSQTVGEAVAAIRCCALASFVFIALGGFTPAKAELVITNLAQIRALTREEAAKAIPVRVHGVVTWQQAQNVAFVVDDGTQAVYVDTTMPKKSGVWIGGNPQMSENEPGAEVVVEGFTDPGGFAPVIACTKFRRIGTGTQFPRHLKLEELISGSADALWVELEGVVQSVVTDQSKVTGIRLLVGGQICRVAFEHSEGLNVTNLLDAELQVRGVLSSVFNMRSEVVGLKLSANGAQDIDVLTPPPKEPFLSSSKVPLNRLRLFSPNSASAFHRKVTQGVVSFAIPNQWFFLQDDNTGVRVASSSAVVQVGEKVEVAGFVDLSRNIASLNEGIIHSLGKGTVSPISATAEQILQTHMYPIGQNITNLDFNYRLVKVLGKLTQVNREGNDGFDEMLVDIGGHLVKAIISKACFSNSPPPVAWQEGSELELTGVCELDFKEDIDIYSTVSIADFQLWLRTPQDVQIIRAPPWWTVKRLWIALAVTSFLIISGIGWSLSLQRLLRKRTNRLEEVMSAHRNVELEYTSARRERLRLAADLHDGLKQLMAAASFRLEAAIGNLPESPLTAAKHLASAHTTLIRTQDELQDCMRGLHVLEEGPPEFESLLRQAVSSNDYWPNGLVTVESQGTPRTLPRDVAGSLLLLFQEAVNNAVNHGLANHIDVLVSYTDESLNLRIVDNGTGFETETVSGVGSGHFGLDGMKNRVKWLRGDFAITRHPTGGMAIIVRVNWSAIGHEELKAPSQMR